MGRTVPSFRNVIAEGKKEWKPFREALDKKERKEMMRCETFPNCIYPPALILFNWCHSTLSSYRYCSTITKSWRNAFLKLNAYDKVNDKRQEEY